MNRCNLCIHHPVCEVWRKQPMWDFIDLVKEVMSSPDAYALFVSSLRESIAINCQRYKSVMESK